VDNSWITVFKKEVESMPAEPRRKKRITDLILKKYNPKSGRKIIWDKDGLGILIGKRKKTWLYRYTFESKRKLITLGAYPVMSLEDAQKDAAEARLKVKQGTDPGSEKKAERANRKAAPTVEEVLEEFWDVELSTRKAGKATKRLLTKDIIPAWGSRKIADIKRRDIVLLLDGIRDRAPIVANRVHGALSRMFNFAAERGIIDDSPATRIRKTKETGRSRVLTDEELKLLWAALDLENKDLDIYHVTKLALKTVLLTGQRPGEVTGMKWDEIEDGVWNNPSGKTGDEEPVQVPLPPLALEVIERARVYANGGPYIFASSHKDGKPITRPALNRAINRHWEELGIKEPFTPHDLRRTLRTRLAELGISDIVAERVMGHKLQGVLGIYNRHDYSVEKRQALETWEGKLREIVGLDKPEAAKVIPIKG
jgi:integrase